LGTGFINQKLQAHTLYGFQILLLDTSAKMQPYTDYEDTPEMSFGASGSAIVLTIILTHVFLICLAFEIAHQSRRVEVNYELGVIDEQTHRVEVDRWVVVPVSGAPLPEYSLIDPAPPPPYKEDVGLDIFIVEVDNDDDE
jgi:hypothetical protein